jgi:quercetin dioxygenase-like cupin family protein
MLRGPRPFVAGAAILLAAGLLISIAQHGATREQVSSLLSTGQTVLGQPVVYPTQSPAKITSAIISMQPGEQTGWHQHDVPMFCYILEGEVTVDYGAKGTHVYRQGEAVMEAIDVAHDGRNTGTGPTRILAVFMGAAGVSDTVMEVQPPPPPQ